LKCPAPDAVKLFAGMKTTACACPPRDCGNLESLIAECFGGKRWRELHSHLWRELRCKVWQWPCIQRPGARLARSERQPSALLALRSNSFTEPSGSKPA